MPPAIKNEFSRSPVSTVASILASLVAVSSLGVVLWAVPSWAKEVEQRLNYNERSDSAHHGDKELHTPVDKQIDRFVTREEWLAREAANQRQLDDIKKSMERQEAKMDKILDRLISNSK